METKNILKIIGGIILSIIALILLLINVYSVDQGEHGILLSWGKVTNVWDEGLHVKCPFKDDVVLVNIRTQVASSPAEAGSKDMQGVNTTVAVNYRFDRDHLTEVYANTGLDVETKIIDPRIQETVKATIAKYAADQLLSQRETVKGAIETMLRTELSKYHIILEGVQITDFRFHASYQKAIEDKQIAEQRALQAKNDLDRIKVEAEQRIVEANAEAKAIQIQVEAIRTQGGAEYVQLKAIEKWNGTLPQYTGSNTPILNLK